MIKKFEEFINEDVTDIYSRLRKGGKRDEDMSKIKQFMSNFKDIEYTINIDGSVDVVGNIEITDAMLIKGKLPIKFGKVSGCFDCSHCESLTSLEGAPREVSEGFYCDWK